MEKVEPMKIRVGWLVATLTLVVCFCAAQQPTKNATDKKDAAVQRLLDKAEKARKTGDLGKAVKLYQQAIVDAPDNEDANRGLSYSVYLTERNRLKAETQAANNGKVPDEFELNKKVDAASSAKLVEIYQPLVSSRPDVPAYQLQLAYAEHRKDGLLKSELERIVATNPKFAPGLAALAGMNAATGDAEKERELYRRACEAAPDNEEYPYFYLSTFKNGDQKEYLRLVDEYLLQHPKSEYVDSMLEDAASNAQSDADRQAWLEHAADRAGTYYVDDLLALYARADVHKAAELAQKKLAGAQKDRKAERDAKEVKKSADYYSTLAHAQDLLKAGKLDEAKATLDKATPPNAEFHPDEFPKTTLMAEVLTAQGKPQDAYKYLLGDRQIIADEDLEAAAVKLGAQLGKTAAQVEVEIVSGVIANAKQPDDFELENLKGDAKIKLSSLRGKYVLVNGWHPT